MTQLAESPTNEFRNDLKQEFQDPEYRYAYAEDFLNTWIATQIVTLREQRGLNQTKFGELIGTKQPGVSRLENVNHSTWETGTLKKIAKALGVRLRISFETFSTLIEEDKKFNRRFLMRPDFENDPGLIERKGPRSEGKMETIQATGVGTGTTGIPSSSDTLFLVKRTPAPVRQPLPATKTDELKTGRLTCPNQ